MPDKYFDPSEIVRGIQQLLVSDKKKIAFLFGAGTSFAKKEPNSPYIPTIGKMTELVLAHLKKDKTNGEKYEKALAEIDEELKQQGQPLNIETLLSNVEEKIRIIGNGTLNNLTKEELTLSEKKSAGKYEKLSASTEILPVKRVPLSSMIWQNGFVMQIENLE